MRRSAALLPLVTLTLFLGLAVPGLAGCGSDDASGSSGSGGAGAGASGSSGATGSTTSSGQGGGGGGPMVVRVQSHGGGALANVDVFFSDPDGNLVVQTKTDATGRASADLPEGGAVTAMWPFAEESAILDYEALSAVGLPAGAEVHLVARPFTLPEGQKFMQMTFQGVPPLESGDWDIVASCRTNDTTLSEKSFQYRGCTLSPSFDIIAFVYPWNKRIVHLAQPNQPGQNVTVSFDLAEAEDVGEVEVDVAGMPADTTLLDAKLWGNRPEGGRTQFWRHQDPTGPQGTHMAIPRVATSPGGSFDLDLTASGPTVTAKSRLAYATLPADAITWSVPAVAPVASIGTVTGTSRRPEIPWTLGGSPADAVRFELSYTSADPPPSNGYHDVRWTVVAPAGAASGTARLPEMPTAPMGWAAPAGASLFVVADHLDVQGAEGVLAAANADADLVSVDWVTTSFDSVLP